MPPERWELKLSHAGWEEPNSHELIVAVPASAELKGWGGADFTLRLHTRSQAKCYGKQRLCTVMLLNTELVQPLWIFTP